MATGNSYEQSTGIENSWVKAVRMVVKDKSPLLKNLKTAKADQRLHQWHYDTAAKPTSNVGAVEGASTTTIAPDNLSYGQNWCQIVKTAYAVSGTQVATSYNGIEDYLAYVTKKAMKKHGLDLEYALEVGTGNAGNITATASTAREVKGLSAWCVAQNTAGQTGTNFAGTAGEVALNDVLEAIVLDGEEANSVLLSTLNKRRVSNWTESNKRYDNAEKKKVSVVSVYESDFGTVTFYTSTMVGDANVCVYDSEAIEIAYLRPTFKQNLAITGDNVPFQVISEATLVVKNPNATGAVILA